MIKEHKGTILVVDDEPANLGVLFEFLGQAGFRVLVAENGRSALERAERSKPDIILLDIKLPDIDGFEVYQQLKEKDWISETTVIFLSVLSEAETIARGLSLSAVDYIIKPFQPLEVVARVEKHLALRDLRRQLEQKNAQLQHEIAERKIAEAEREATRHLMQTTLNGMNDPVVLIGNDYQVLWANKAMHEMYALDEKVEPLFCYQLSHEQDKPCNPATCTCALKEVRREMKPVTVRHEHIQADGEVRHLEIVASPLLDADGNLTGIVEATRDITDRLLTDKKLRDQAYVLENISDAIITTDLNFKIVDWNQAAERTYGWKAAEVIGKPVGKLTQQEYQDSPREEVIAQFTAQDYWRGEVIQICKDGTRLNILASVSLIKDHLGNPTGVVSVNRDITAQKRANQAKMEIATINERQRLARDLHDSMTQSLDSLILSIDSATHYLHNDRYEDLSDAFDMLGAAAKQTRQEMRLLLFELQLAPNMKIDLVELLTTRLNTVEQRVGIETSLTVDGVGNLPREWEVALFYVAMESLNNTLKHANANQVTVLIQANPYQLVMRVTDNGSGFTVDDFMDCGMGLRNMQTRAANLGGTLTIDSVPGEGTCVELSVAR